MRGNPNDDGIGVSAVFAGWLMGYAMSLVTTFVFVLILARLPRGTWIDRVLSERLPVGLLAVPLSLFLMLAWTIAGLLLGLFWVIGSFDTKPAGVGSPSWQFTLIVVVLAVLPLPVLVVFFRRFWWLWVGLSALFAALFGWAMPVLAVR